MPYPNPELREALTATLEWWRDAGVDCAYREDPRDWLAAPDRAPGAMAEPANPDARIGLTGHGHGHPPKQPPPRLGGPRAQWPADLAAFALWWTTLPGADRIGGLDPLVAPAGPHGAPLMVLVEQPAGGPDAGDPGTVLSNSDAALAQAMLRAMGIAWDTAYRAAVLPRAVAMPDWPALAEMGLGAVVRHHLALAAPRAVLALGRNILPLLTHGTAQDPAGLREIQHDGGSVAVLAAPPLRDLATSARLRARLWQAWLDWDGAIQTTRDTDGDA